MEWGGGPGHIVGLIRVLFAVFLFTVAAADFRPVGDSTPPGPINPKPRILYEPCVACDCPADLSTEEGVGPASVWNVVLSDAGLQQSQGHLKSYPGLTAADPFLYPRLSQTGASCGSGYYV